MSCFSDYWENLILQHIFNISSGVTTNLYLGLSSQDPLDDASGVSEPPGKGYARLKTTNGSGSSWEFQAIATGVTVQNKETLDLPRATSPWGTLTYFGIFNDKTAGASICAHGALDKGIIIGIGDTFRFNLGQLKIYERRVEAEEAGVRVIAKTLTSAIFRRDVNYRAAIFAKTHSGASFATAFLWEDTADFEFEDTSGFEWKDT